MILDSFVDEIIKLGGLRCLYKQAYGDGGVTDPTTSMIPEGLVGSGEAPQADPHRPNEAASRLPNTGHLASTVESGNLGDVTPPKDPVDKDKFNRLKFYR